MKVKTYRGRSVQEVLQQIKIELGEDAVILNTHNYSEGGKNVCEVVVGIEPEVEEDQAELDGTAGQEWSSFQKQWLQFKDQLFSLIRPQIDMERLTSRQGQLVKYLEKEGVDTEVLLKLWDKLKDRPDASGVAELSRLVSLKPWQSDKWKERCHALVGPHGVGKTSTLLRMAMKYKQENPGKKICLLNADAHQGKGRLFLRHYAELSDLEYKEALEVEDWSSMSEQLQRYDKIFIDIPGLGANKDLSTWWTENGVDVLPDVCIHLVLSPLYSNVQLNAFVNKFFSPKRTSVIWTKLDEACSFGSLINTSFFTGLPISLITYSPGLKNSMAAAEDKKIWKLIFKHSLPG